MILSGGRQTLPSRKAVLPGLNYKAKDYDEMIERQEELSTVLNSGVKVRPWRMEAGLFTQFEIVYKGSKTIVCIRDDSPVKDVNEISQAIEDFYKIVDLEKTAVLKKASANDKPVLAMKAEAHMGKTKLLNRAEIGLTAIGKRGKIHIYKERTIQIFSLAKKSEDGLFTTRDVIENVYNASLYPTASEATKHNKAAANVKYMLDQGWIEKRGFQSRNASFYSVVTNPFESEMPAQAEPIDKEFAEKTKADALNAYREA